MPDMNSPHIVPTDDLPDRRPDAILKATIIHEAGGIQAVPVKPLTLHPGDQAQFVFDFDPVEGERAEVWVYRANWWRRQLTRLRWLTGTGT